MEAEPTGKAMSVADSSWLCIRMQLTMSESYRMVSRIKPQINQRELNRDYHMRQMGASREMAHRDFRGGGRMRRR